MVNPYFRIVRTALGLSAKEVGERVGRTIRTIRLYDAGVLDPAVEVSSETETMVDDMAARLAPFIGVRSGSQRTYTLYDYENDEVFQQLAGDEYAGWSLGQYRAFLGHVVLVLRAKGVSYQIVLQEKVF